ncbi:hypothetical protein MMC17_005346 [Xylographa soralifera]|nr:hypothetical protein [Xylographa soralifera]
MMCRHAPLPSDPVSSYSELSDNEPEDKLRYRCAYLAPDPFTGTPYPRGSMQLEKIWEGPSVDDVMTKVRDQNNMFLNLEQTTFYLENLLEPTKASLSTIPGKEREQMDYELRRHRQYTPEDKEVQGAIRRLQCIPKLRSWGPDIVYKAFDDLDLVLFRGALRGCSKLRWTDTETFIKNYANLEPMAGHGVTSNFLIPPGFVALPHEEVEPIPCLFYQSCAYIHLNTTSHFLQPIQAVDRSRWDEMWGTLLHEMVHAYLRVTINPTRRDFERTDPQRLHGRHFQRCIRAINARLEQLGIGIGGVFQNEWAVQVEGCWLDQYGTAWPCKIEGDEEEEDCVDGEESSPSTAATSPSLGTTDASCLEQDSELDLALCVISSTDHTSAAPDYSLTDPENTVARSIDTWTKPKHTLAESIHACA